MEQDMMMAEQAEPAPMIAREKPVTDPAREALVKHWIGEIQKAKKHWASKFESMRANQRFVAGRQWGDNDNDERYVSNLVQRHIQQRTAALYAKNPRFIARRKKKLDFALWDGNLASVQMALQGAAMGDPNALALLADVQSGMQTRKLLERMGKTAQMLMQHEVDEQIVPFKVQMKQAVRRALVNAVAYVKLGFVREYEMRPDDAEKYNATAEQLALMERLTADMVDEQMKSEADAEVEQLRLLLAQLSSGDTYLVREGLVFDFPASTSVIPDPKMRQLKGFIGAQWIAQEFMLTPNQVKELYKIDLQGSGYARYSRDDKGDWKVAPASREGDHGEGLAAVYVIHSKRDGLVYVVAEGYCDFLQEPAEPEVKLERFWPIFALSFNDAENEADPIPPSEVDLLRPMQLEHNRAREGLREHRYANRPLTGVASGKLSEPDKAKLENRPANAVVELQAMQPGEDINKLLQAVRHPPIDPAVYDTAHLFDDMQRVVGGSEAASFGGTSGSTATEVAVAESSRATANSSHVDDLDDLLNELARAAGQILMMEMSQDKVMEIVGPGAVWPTLSVNDAARELYLQIEAGSSGKPNKAMEIQNFQQLAPFLLQIPGVSPELVAKMIIERLDDRIDLEDLIIPGLPSITAMNAAPQIGTGDPATDPQAQGGEGGDNAPQQAEAATQPGAKQAHPQDFMPVMPGM